MRQTVVLLIAAIALAGCASARMPDRTKWTQYSPSAQALASARGQCEAQAQGALPGADTHKIMDSCMYSKGWMR